LLIGSGIVFCSLGVLDSSSLVCCVAESSTALPLVSEWEFAHGNSAKSKVNELLGLGAMVLLGRLAGMSGK
jgi:hypothetical protein